jgi:hypothetical protein
MGSITYFDLNTYIDEHKCDVYVETGTGIADCLSHAIKYPFNKFYSVELDVDLANDAKLKIPNDNVEIINDYSTNALNNIVPILPKETPVLFFLDAHFPGADFHKITYEESIRKYKEESLPLEMEVDIIMSKRDISHDVFIVDDWFLYQPELKYEAHNTVNWTYKSLQNELGLITDGAKIIRKFESTHNHTIDPRHQGYLILTPKNN